MWSQKPVANCKIFRPPAEKFICLRFLRQIQWSPNCLQQLRELDVYLLNVSACCRAVLDQIPRWNIEPFFSLWQKLHELPAYRVRHLFRISTLFQTWFIPFASAGFLTPFLFLFQLVALITAETLTVISDLVNDFTLTYIEVLIICINFYNNS